MSCLLPAGIHSKSKVQGISDNSAYSLSLPFGHITLSCLISDSADHINPPHPYLVAMTSRPSLSLKKRGKHPQAVKPCKYQLHLSALVFTREGQMELG